MKTATKNNPVIFILLIILSFSSIELIAQNNLGTIKGQVTDHSNGTALTFADVVLMKEGNQITVITSDFNGNSTCLPAILTPARTPEIKFSRARPELKGTPCPIGCGNLCTKKTQN